MADEGKNRYKKGRRCTWVHPTTGQTCLRPVYDYAKTNRCKAHPLCAWRPAPRTPESEDVRATPRYETVVETR